MAEKELVAWEKTDIQHSNLMPMISAVPGVALHEKEQTCSSYCGASGKFTVPVAKNSAVEV
jgi:hypothetical protein